MYQHLLLPSDGSEDSRRAAERAREIAEAHDARVTLTHVIGELETGELELFAEKTLEEKLKSVKIQEAEQLLGETERTFDGSSVETTTEVLTGRPHRAICEYVDRADVDLVVMGTSGRETLTEQILGSTTERVTKLCDVPVLVV